jgi:hypothetical protein
VTLPSDGGSRLTVRILSGWSGALRLGRREIGGCGRRRRRGFLQLGNHRVGDLLRRVELRRGQMGLLLDHGDLGRLGQSVPGRSLDGAFDIGRDGLEARRRGIAFDELSLPCGAAAATAKPGL